MAARDRFGTLGNNQLHDPAVGGFAITKSDSVELQEVTRKLYVGTAGTLTVVMATGQTVAFLGTGLPNGIHELRVKQVKTGGTADNLVGLI